MADGEHNRVTISNIDSHSTPTFYISTFLPIALSLATSIVPLV